MTSLALLSFIALMMVVSEIQLYQDEIRAYLDKKAVNRTKTEAQRFYTSNEWHKAKREVRRLQMEISGLDFIFCEDCGITSKHIDICGRPIVMSVGHDRARSTHDHLKLVIDNLFNQCMPCNLAQGTSKRLRTGYNAQ